MIAVTSVEQSKRLIEAGISPTTADMYLIGRGITVSAQEDEYTLKAEPYYPLFEKVKRHIEAEEADKWKYCFDTSGEIEAAKDFLSRLIPVWSFSAIWDLMSTTNAVSDYLTSDKSQKVLDSLVETLIRFAKQGGV